MLPVKLNPAIEVIEPPKEIESVPIVNDEFCNPELPIVPRDNSNLLPFKVLVTGDVPTISKLSPKLISKLVEVLSPILIDLFTNLSFVILPVNWAFSIVPDKAVVGYEFASDKFNAGVASVAPKARDTPPIDIELLSNAEFGIWLNVFVAPLIVLFESVSVDDSVTIEPSVDNSILLFVIAVLIPEPPTISKLPPKSTLKFVDVSSPIVIDELSNFEFGNVDKALEGIFVIVFVEPSIVLFARTWLALVVT